MERTVELVVPPAIEACRSDGVDPLPQRDVTVTRPYAAGALVGCARAGWPERIREVDPEDEPRVEASDAVRSRTPLPEMPEVQEDRKSVV